MNSSWEQGSSYRKESVEPMALIQSSYQRGEHEKRGCNEMVLVLGWIHYLKKKKKSLIELDPGYSSKSVITHQLELYIKQKSISCHCKIWVCSLSIEPTQLGHWCGMSNVLARQCDQVFSIVL